MFCQCENVRRVPKSVFQLLCLCGHRLAHSDVALHADTAGCRRVEIKIKTPTGCGVRLKDQFSVHWADVVLLSQFGCYLEKSPKLMKAFELFHTIKAGS